MQKRTLIAPEKFALQTDTIDIADCRLAYETWGEGEPVILAHGFGLERGSMRALARRLGENHQVVLLDWRGHGQTVCPDSDEAFSYPIMRDDLLGLIDALGFERVHLVGHSMGGQIALTAAIDQPTRVASLTAIASGPSRPVTDEREKASWRSGAAFFERGKQSDLIGMLAKTTPLANSDSSAIELASLYASARGPDLARMIRGAFLHVKANDEACRALATPTLVIAGELDKAWLEPSRKLSSLVPDAELKLFAEAGHLVHLEQAEAVGSAVAAFIDCHGARS